MPESTRSHHGKHGNHDPTPGPRWRPRAAVPALVLLLVSAAGELSAQSITGRVISVMDRAPVVDAVVRLEGTARRARTDSLGSFVFDGVEPGRYELVVEHPSYHAVRRTVDVAGAGPAALEIVLAPQVITLEAIDVTAQRLDAAERRARATGSGQSLYVGPDEVRRLEAVGHYRIGSALTRLGGARFRVVERRQSVCVVLARRGGYRTPSNPQGGGCATVFIDGIPLPKSVGPDYLYALPLGEVHSIEVLGPGDATFRFGRAGRGGAVLITTPLGAYRAAQDAMDRELAAVRRHHGYLGAGTAVGVLAGLGVGYAQGIFEGGGVQARDFYQFAGTVLAGLVLGEVVYRITGRDD